MTPCSPRRAASIIASSGRSPASAATFTAGVRTFSRWGGRDRIRDSGDRRAVSGGHPPARSILAFDELQVDDRPPDDRPELRFRGGERPGHDEAGDVARLADTLLFQVRDDFDKLRRAL